MILLVTPIDRRNECAAALQQATGEAVVIAETLAQAATHLRRDDYTAAIFDQNLAETEPHETDTALQHLGTAIPVQINLAISGVERLVREVRGALRRRSYEYAIAREGAARVLHGEFNDTLTRLLLACESALETTGLPPAATQQLIAIHESALTLCVQLKAGGSVT